MSVSRCDTCGLPSGWLAPHRVYPGIYAEASARGASGEWGAAFRVRLSRRGGFVRCWGCRDEGLARRMEQGELEL